MCIWMQLFTKQYVQFANSCQVLLTIYVLLIFLELMKHEPSHMVDIDIRYIIVLFFLFYLNGYILYLFLFSRERNMIRCHICSMATRCNKFITYGFRKTCTILMMIFVIFVVISCHSGVEATGTLKENFASDNHHHTYSKIYEKAKYTMKYWLQNLPSGPSPSGPGH